jgi:acyl-coenzyme A thioesterase PaaI-like protein
MKEESIEFDPSTTDKREFYANFLSQYQPPVDASRHFASISWTNNWLTNPTYKVIPFWSRHAKSSGEDYFFANTINTIRTVPHMVTLQLRDFTTPEPGDGASVAGSAQAVVVYDSTPANRRSAELVFLLQLGEHGIDGHPGVIHGGVTCALLDETMSVLVSQHLTNATPRPQGQIFTANLNTSFRAPVATPATVIIKCWLIRREKRKWLTKGQIEDEHGRILAEANAIWVVAQKNKI